MPDLSDDVICKNGVFTIENDKLMNIKTPSVVSFVEDFLEIMEFKSKSVNNDFAKNRI